MNIINKEENLKENQTKVILRTETYHHTKREPDDWMQ